jgi:site-specific DNA recombinase
MEHVLAYARVSTQLQADDEQALEQQINQLKRAGYTELFVDIQSGRDPSRPNFLALIDRALYLAESGESVTILVVELQRFARNTSVSMEAIDRLDRAGVVIREVSGGPISIKRAADWLSVGMRSLWAEYYSRDLSERVKRGNEYRRIAGKPMCNQPPLGYKYNEDCTKLLPNPELWVIAREIINRLLGGSSLNDVSRWLFDEHQITRHRTSLRYWLLNPVIRGHTCYSEGGLTRAEVKAGIKKKKEFIYDTHDALLTEPEYEQIRKQLQVNKDLSGKNKGKTVLPIPPIVVCDVCGRKMSGRKNGNRHRLYRCGKADCSNRKPSVKSTDIEAAIQDKLSERAEEIIDSLTTPQGTVVDSSLVKLEEQLKKSQELYEETGRQSFKLSIEEIESEIRQIKGATSQKEAALFGKRELVDKLRRKGFFAKIGDVDRRFIYMDLVFQVRCKDTVVVKVILKF